MVHLNVNGQDRSVDGDPDTPLLYVLRDAFALGGAKFGCGLGQCGACTVLVDGAATRSCLVPLADVAGKSVITPEGIGTPERPHPLQAAFIAEQAAQSGCCTGGMVMQAKALLDRVVRPSDAEIRAELAGNLCRCGTQPRVIRAIKRAAGVLND